MDETKQDRSVTFELDSPSKITEEPNKNLLNVPDDDATSRRSSIRSNVSVDEQSSESSFRRRSAKWFTRIVNNDDTISRNSDNDQSPQKVDVRYRRKKSVTQALARRGRSIRKRLSAAKINEAENGDSGRDGYVLKLEDKLRIFALKEIVETEDRYTKLLQFLMDVMIPNLQKCVSDDAFVSVTDTTVGNLFSNIAELHKLHVKFVSELQQETYPFPYYTNCIGKVFLKYRDDFAAYSHYCTNFAIAQQLSFNLQEDPALKNLIKDWRNSIASNTRKFLRLEEFIIAPVQRLCKYPLLLKELAKFTDENHPDYSDVIEAKQMMEETTMLVNESQRKAIAVKAMKDVEESCDTWNKSGNLSKQGFLTKQGGSRKNWNIRWFILIGYSMSYYVEPTETMAQGVLDLTSYKSLEEDASHTERPHAFGIQMPDRTYYMYCTSENEKQEWINILKWKFSCIDRSRSQTHRPVETVIFASLSSFMNPKDQNATFREAGNPIGDKRNTKLKPRRTRSLFNLSLRNKVRGSRNRVKSHT